MWRVVGTIAKLPLAAPRAVLLAEQAGHCGASRTPCNTAEILTARGPSACATSGAPGADQRLVPSPESSSSTSPRFHAAGRNRCRHHRNIIS
eukprot:5885154-Pyramimonas_sp.AAC.1